MQCCINFGLEHVELIVGRRQKLNPKLNKLADFIYCRYQGLNYTSVFDLGIVYSMTTQYIK